ncbi:hypothetical protein ACLI4Z_04835 [Natrialbaceae archaeon A-arb3/5]
MNRTEQYTLVLFLAYVGSLAVVYSIDEPVAWLAWATAVVIVSGAAMVLANRSKAAT